MILIQYYPEEQKFELFLDKSVPYVGIKYPQQLGYDGTGIVIGVIDTGIDHRHPDLFGLGPDGKISKGYNFFKEGESSLDLNGHGTEVAGIIAADGMLKGVAPKAKIIAYKVSDDGESVSSNLIIRAIEQAIIDEVDIINISLGVNRTNSKIDSAVNKAIDEGIVVIVAAGNDGPELNTIGSPGKNPNAITVGATYNNSTSSLVATLSIGEKQYQIIPMIGVNSLDVPLGAKIIFADYGRERDFKNENFKDSIVLVERGSNVEDEIVYFSNKEENAANAGASALIVYNNQPGIFLGELIHEFIEPDYHPRIPTVSMSREDGLAIKEILVNQTIGTLNVFSNPDFVAIFSSRGPVSSFYNKPDIVAPGAFVNTTLNNGEYNFTSGTSFAAPHVTGAAALLLQKNPELLPNEIKSLLVTTTDIVTDAYDNEFPFEAAGSGRLNVTKAFDANLIISPTFLIFDLSPEKIIDEEILELNPINGNSGEIEVSLDVPKIIKMEYENKDNSLELSAYLMEEVFGEYYGRIKITDDYSTYNIPILVRSSQGSISSYEEDGKLNFEIKQPVDWTYAKISIINSKTGEVDSTSARPYKKSNIPVFENGEYWIEAKIEADKKIFDAFEKIDVKFANENNFEISRLIKIPEKQIIIIVAAIISIGIVGIRFRKI